MPNQTLLIIDDSPDVHDLVGAWLADEPVAIHAAYDGASGIDTAARLRPDLILLDVEMPDLDGFAVCARLKADPGLRDVPVVFLSGASTTEEKLRGLDMGAVDYVTKPFDPAELRARVRASLRTKQLLDLLEEKAVILRESEERWSFALEGSGDGVWDWDLKTGVATFSRRYKQMLGYGEHELCDGLEGWQRLLHPDDLAGARAAVEAYLGGTSATYTNEFRMRCHDGSWKWILARGMVVRRDPAGKPLRVVGTHTDISERRAMEEELRTAARMDKLTGLPNRALVLDRLQLTIARHKRDPACRYAVLFLDFDRFKLVNDTLGHEAGDQLLRAIARRLEKAVRAVDSVAREPDLAAAQGTASRLGGDEFVILLTDLRAEGDAKLVADRILAAMGAPYTLGGVEVVSTASIGIVTSEFGHDRAEDVLRDADTAMYEAKVAGRGRAATFDGSMRARVQRKADLERGLRQALDAGQFELHYQPIVSLSDGRVEGFEALVRWQHPQHGMIPPGEFIPVAEETGLIVPLGEWVFREVCRQVVAWRTTVGRELLGQDPRGGPADAGPVADAVGRLAIPPVGVNLSRAQLALRHLPDLLATIAEESGVGPSAIHLEVTESAVMADAEQAVRVLRRIKGMGFGVHLDDFGTGYSSLSSLHQFPLDVLKIDRSFVANLARGAEFAAVIGAIAMLARNLGIGVIAEGIETATQADLLRSLDCRSGQGYLFAKPMPAVAVPAYLVAHSRGDGAARIYRAAA